MLREPVQQNRLIEPLRVLVVADKFKGTLTAEEAAAAIANGWSRIRRNDVIASLPMSDGGDGFGRVMGHLLDAEPRSCPTIDCSGRPREATWYFVKATSTAVIEAAEVNGLCLLPPNRYHPFELDTFGLGAVLHAAASAGATRIYLGVGGSGTNDGGFGLARSLGWMFWDSNGIELRRWTALTTLARMTPAPSTRLAAAGLVIAVDVANPLLGASGATCVFGPQKGLCAADLAHAEACLTRLADVALVTFGRDHATEPGAGAAGGLGFTLRAFAGGRFLRGAQVFAEVAQLEQRIAEVDLVITAEGCFDAQSSMGKGVGYVAELSSAIGKPCLCLAALNEAPPDARPWRGFSVHSIVPLIADKERASTHAAECLARLASHVASEWGDRPHTGKRDGT